MTEKYEPSQEEIKKAESMMTPEEADMSELREKYKFQKRDPFDEFMEHIDQDGIRRPPTPEETEMMDSHLKTVSDLFEGADVNWHLDGALNISLANGEYIGIHKDVDISVEADELEKLDDHLGKKGYGLFLSHQEDPSDPRGKKIMERVGASQLLESDEHPMIVRIDERGKIREVGSGLNFIDTHIVKRGEDGSPIGWGGVKLPKKWFEPVPTKHKDGALNASHPAKVAYFKLHGQRSYDQTDLEALAKTGVVTTEDVDDIEKAYTEEIDNRTEGAKRIIGDIAKDITPEMSADDIFSAFAKHPEVAGRIKRLEHDVRKLSEKIAESDDRSPKTVVELGFEALGVTATNATEKEKLKRFRVLVEDQEELKSLRTRV